VDADRLTQKSQEALHDAQTIALYFGHAEVDGEHLLLALLRQADGLVPRLLLQADVDADALAIAVEEDLSRRPRVSGPGASPGQVFLTQRLSRLLDTAEQEAKRLKDEYVSVEHLVIALLNEGPSTPPGAGSPSSGWSRTSSLPRSRPSAATNESGLPCPRSRTRRSPSTDAILSRKQRRAGWTQ